MERPLLLIDRPEIAGHSGGVVRLGAWASSGDDPFCLSPPDIEPYPTPEAVRGALDRSLRAAKSLFDVLVDVIPREVKPGGSLPVRFWDMFLTYYLIQLAGVVEDIRCRCACLGQMDLIYGAPLNAAPEPPQTFSDYMRQSLSPSALRIALVDVCVRAHLRTAEERPVMYREDPPVEDPRGSWLSRSRWANALLAAGLKAIAFRGPTGAVLWDRYHLAWTDVLRLARIGLPLFRPDPRGRLLPRVEPDHALRGRIFGGLPDPYSVALRLTFPVLALEGLPSSIRAGRRLIKALTGRTRQIYTFGRPWADPEPLRAAAGLLVAEGATVTSIQHGGGFAGYESSAPACAEYRLSDRFVSWGWTDPGYEFDGGRRIVPMPSLYLSRLAARRTAPRAARWQILFLVFSDPLYPKWLYTPVFPEFAHEYFHREKVLLDGLKGEAPSAVKLYPSEFGWRQNEWITRRYPELEMLRTGAFPDFARRARLCVVDYNATGFLELLAMERPFMATWDRRWFRGTPAFERRLDALQEVGLFYEKPNDVIDAYYAIKPEIESWWGDSTRQRVVRVMAGEFARVSQESLRDWQRFTASTT